MKIRAVCINCKMKRFALMPFDFLGQLLSTLLSEFNFYISYYRIRIESLWLHLSLSLSLCPSLCLFIFCFVYIVFSLFIVCSVE